MTRLQFCELLTECHFQALQLEIPWDLQQSVLPSDRDDNKLRSSVILKVKHSFTTTE